MRQALAKLLLLLAIIAMPFGMAAPAVAAPQALPHGATMPMDHCPDEGTMSHANGGTADCTMACAATLPALAARANERLAPNATLARRVLVSPLSDRHPETATPPPRLA